MAKSPIAMMDLNGRGEKKLLWQSNPFEGLALRISSNTTMHQRLMCQKEKQGHYPDQQGEIWRFSWSYCVLTRSISKSEASLFLGYRSQKRKPRQFWISISSQQDTGKCLSDNANQSFYELTGIFLVWLLDQRILNTKTAKAIRLSKNIKSNNIKSRSPKHLQFQSHCRFRRGFSGFRWMALCS